MSLELPIAIPLQDQPNWCWAAVSLGVHRYYFTPALFQQQCEVASLFGPGCCVNPTSCDIQRRLEPALGGVRCLAGSPIAGALPPQLLSQQIEGLRRPVCAHITWRGGGPQHFVAITGCSENGAFFLTIQDPARGVMTFDYQQFATNYLGMGFWDFSYLTGREV